MRSVAISAVFLGVVHVTPGGPAVAAMPAVPPAVTGEGADGGAGLVLARAGASPFLAVPEAQDPALVPVGEGGRGRGHGWGPPGRPHGYVYGWGWGPPPPAYYYAPPPVYYRPPPPRVYYAPPPPVYYAPPPPVFYAPAPGISLNFRF